MELAMGNISKEQVRACDVVAAGGISTRDVIAADITSPCCAQCLNKCCVGWMWALLYQ